MRLSATAQLGIQESLTSNVRRQIALCGTFADGSAEGLKEWLTVNNFATNRQIDEWSELTDQSTDLIRESTFRSVAAALPAFDDVLEGRAPVMAAARRTWLWPRSTQACLSCLREKPDQWHLRWRLPWIFMCLNHRQLLETHCPLCERQLREQHKCPRGSDPDRHWVWGSTDEPATNEKRAPVQERHREEPTVARWMGAASLVDQALREQTITVLGGQIAGSADYLEALRGLVGLQWHSHYRNPTRRRVVAAPPINPATRADLITRATEILAEPPGHAVRILDDILRSIPRRSGFQAWLVDHSSRSPILDPILAILADQEKSTGRLTRNSSTARSLPPSAVPQVVSEGIWAELNAGWSGGQVAGRCFAAMAYIKYTHNTTWIAAAELLDIPRRLGYSASRVGARSLTSRPSDFIKKVAIALEAGTAPAVDYEFRRRVTTALQDDHSELSDLRAVLDRPHLNQALLIERVWTRWAGGHPLLTPGLSTTTPIDRQRAATQRARWTSDETVQLLRWCNNTFQPRKPPARRRLPSNADSP